jgi:formiminoglutamase
MVGFPVDEGVRRNGGRVGAAEGPAAIRRHLYRLSPDPRRHDAFVELLEHTIDLGDVTPTGNLETDQQALGEVVGGLIAPECIPIILAGGHETTYGHFLGYVKANRAVSVINWDAHPDVRPLLDGLGHSGSPFRQVLDHGPGACPGYTVLGLNPHAVARSHLDWLSAHRGNHVLRHEVNRERIATTYANLSEDVLVTFDLDAVDASSAPGVSAPATPGLSSELWLEAAYRAGACEHVRSMDVVELNPRFDVDDRTARLAAVTVWHFLSGLAERRPAS